MSAVLAWLRSSEGLAAGAGDGPGAVGLVPPVAGSAGVLASAAGFGFDLRAAGCEPEDLLPTTGSAGATGWGTGAGSGTTCAPAGAVLPAVVCVPAGFGELRVVVVVRVR